MSKKHPFEAFLDGFVPKVAAKSKQLKLARWLLETTGSQDAAELKAALDTELCLLYNDRTIYQKLLEWDKDSTLKDPLLKRQLNVLIRAFKQNMISPELLSEISQKEAALSCAYLNFRPRLEGKSISENEIREILKREDRPELRKKAWEASKEIGNHLAPQILELVRLRNRAAKSLGYPDYFQMQLDLQEVDPSWLAQTFEAFYQESEKAYASTIGNIEQEQAARFKVAREELGPWAWSEPFSQEDPLDTQVLDALVDKIDIYQVTKRFYQGMGFDIEPIYQRSDMFEREGKNQHAFCLNLDRQGDIRTLNNIKPTIRWLEIVLHEFGHAVYDLGCNPHLPWLLREPPHVILTEAMAQMAGRRAYLSKPLSKFVGLSQETPLAKKAEESLKRRQQIFNRWVLVMTEFEQALYRDPDQELNLLWWKLVEKYQKICPPKERQGKQDWAAKYHVGFCPVYYYSYLLGELLASTIEEAIQKETGSDDLSTLQAGQFLREKLFAPGNRLDWVSLVKHVIGAPLTSEAWVKQFA